VRLSSTEQQSKIDFFFIEKVVVASLCHWLMVEKRSRKKASARQQVKSRKRHGVSGRE